MGQMTEKGIRYFAIAGDIVASRSMPADLRQSVQKNFENVLQRLNQEWSTQLCAKFRIVAGDETHGLLRSAEPVCNIIHDIQAALQPAEIVFGVGGGLISELSEFADNCEGPAIEHAVQALAKAKKERKTSGESNLREVVFMTHSSDTDELLNNLFLALSVIKSRWSEREKKVLCQLDSVDEPGAAATHLKTPRTEIQELINSGSILEFRQIAEYLQKCLTRL
jgi:hypothetical protein